MAATFVDRSLSYSSRVMAWYRRIQFETDSGGRRFSASNPQLVGTQSGRMSLKNLLQAIQATASAAQPPTRILVICHGSPTGPAIPLVSRVNRRDRRAHQMYLGMLSGRIALNGRPIDPLSDDTSANRAPTTQELANLLAPVNQTELDDIRQLMNAVQAMPIEYLDFRACNLATAQSTSQPTLQEIAHFFSIPNVCAPTVRDAYGPMQIETVSNTQVLSRRTSSMVNYPDLRQGHGREILVYMQRRGRRPLHVLAQDRDHVARWITQSFVAENLSGGVYQMAAGQVPSEINWHGFEAASGSRYHPSFIFPGMPEYSSNLVTHFEASLAATSP